MANYVCSKLVLNVCHQWVEVQSSTSLLAITEQQRDAIIISSLIAIFTAWGIRQVLNMIYRRRY